MAPAYGGLLLVTLDGLRSALSALSVGIHTFFGTTRAAVFD
jgi:hypothetical protein